VAARSGIGYYGKNSLILNADYGSWIDLMGFITDARLAPDEAVKGDCGECDLCLKACPVKALHIPYQCDANRCVNFHIIQNKKWIPEDIRPAFRNLLSNGCTVCKDVCPKNKHLKPLTDIYTPKDLLNPSLLDILEMDDNAWESTFGSTVMGFSLGDKKYLKRNACIALGNFKDERAVPALRQQQINGNAEIKEYAEWAIEKIKHG
jgi:epoxyqueuosine reductase